MEKKYLIESFTDFINYKNEIISESSKWTKDEFKVLHKFVDKMKDVNINNIDISKDNDVEKAIVNLASIGHSRFGDKIWNLGHLEKMEFIKFQGTEWVPATEEETKNKQKISQEYFQLETNNSELVIEMVKAIEDKDLSHFESLLNTLETNSDKAWKMNAKWQKDRTSWRPIDNADEVKSKDNRSIMWNNFLKEMVKATSNLKAQKTLNEDLNRFK